MNSIRLLRIFTGKNIYLLISISSSMGHQLDQLSQVFQPFKASDKKQSSIPMVKCQENHEIKKNCMCLFSLSIIQHVYSSMWQVKHSINDDTELSKEKRQSKKHSQHDSLRWVLGDTRNHSGIRFAVLELLQSKPLSWLAILHLDSREDFVSWISPSMMLLSMRI